ncbi:MAG: GbsR/MarR family transcriptional regulator [Phycisphaerales bacterium]
MSTPELPTDLPVDLPTDLQAGVAQSAASTLAADAHGTKACEADAAAMAAQTRTGQAGAVEPTDPSELTDPVEPAQSGKPAIPVDPRLAAARQRFVDLWSRMASTWGISRTMAEVHALLLMSDGPRNSDEVMEALGISRGNASMTLRRLVEWELVTRVHLRGDRKEYFTAEQDVWQMFRTILAQRKKRELDPLLSELGSCRVNDLAAEVSSERDRDAADAADADSRIALHDERIDELTGFMMLTDAVCTQILGEGRESAPDVARRLSGGDA